MSRHLVEITTQKLKEFKERDLSEMTRFAIFIDTLHRGGEAFVIGLGTRSIGSKGNVRLPDGQNEGKSVYGLIFCDERCLEMFCRGHDDLVVKLRNTFEGQH